MPGHTAAHLGFAAISQQSHANQAVGQLPLAAHSCSAGILESGCEATTLCFAFGNVDPDMVHMCEVLHQWLLRARAACVLAWTTCGSAAFHEG